MKRTALAIALILALSVSLMVGVFVKVVEADPFFIFKNIDPIPGTIPPNITISSPQNNTGYSSDKITVSFNVSKPQLGKFGTSIIDITYTLDNVTVQVFTIWKGESASSSSGIPEFNTTFTLPSLTTGNHSFTVKANGVVFASGLDIFFMNSSSTTFFTIAEEPEPQQSEPFPTAYSMGTVGIIILILLGAIVYILKHKR